MLKPTARIRFKLILAFSVISLLVLLIAAFAVEEQLDSAEIAAITESEHLATVLAYSVSDDVINESFPYVRNFVERVHRIYHRDITIVDLNKIGIADSQSTDIGKVYQDDKNNEVGQTLKDGHPRTFTEVSPLFRSGTKEIVVPLKREGTPILGAVILEYSPIYEEFLDIAKVKIRLIILATAVCIVLALVTGLVVARRMTRPLATLAHAAADFASGKFDTRVKIAQQDEMGTLANAFNNMAADLKLSRDKLLSYGRELESKIAERTAELEHAKANLEKNVAERTSQLHSATEELRHQAAELSERNREITLFSEINDFLQASNTEAEACSVISKTATQLFPEDSGSLFVLSASRNIVEAHAVWGPTPPTNVVFPPNECWALRRGQGHLVVGNEVRCRHVTEDGHMYACLPLVAQGETLGILHVSNGPLGNDKANEDRMREKYRLAKNFAENIGLAIANLKLRDVMRSLSIRDPLTGLFNRRYLEEVLTQELHRVKRQGTQLAVIMLDIDHFKQFNDSFGHDAGDAVLRELGLFLKKHIRGSDSACRYGGEEFILTLSPATMESVRQRAEQLREDAKHLNVHHAYVNLGAITLSLGVAIYPNHASEFEALVKAADIALYQAKQGGRDRVVMFSGKADQTTL